MMATFETAAQDHGGDVQSLDSTFKSSELQNADTLFRDMRREIEEDSKRRKKKRAVGFAASATALGIHGPMPTSSRSPDKPFASENTEPELRQHHSGDG